MRPIWKAARSIFVESLHAWDVMYRPVSILRLPGVLSLRRFISFNVIPDRLIYGLSNLAYLARVLKYLLFSDSLLESLEEKPQFAAT